MQQHTNNHIDRAQWSVRPLIVIPTRNRPDLALMAIKSILKANLPQIAVIVSDNSTEESYVTELQESIDALGGVSLTYIRPGKSMSMTDHWQWILDHALTLSDWTHIAYLTDRHIFRDGSLKLLTEILHDQDSEVVSFSRDAVFDMELPFKYHRADWTGWLYTVTSAQLLHLASEGHFAQALPMAVNALVSKRYILAVKALYGNCFENVSPDYSFAFKLLTVVMSIYYVDVPLIVSHGHDRSNGWAYITGLPNKHSEDFQQSAGDAGVAAFTEFNRIQTSGNAMYSEYLYVAAHNPSKSMPPINQRQYIGLIYRDIADLRNRELADLYLRMLRDAGYEESVRDRGPFSPSMSMRIRRKFWHLISGPATRQLWGTLHRFTGLGVPYGGHFEFTSTDEAFGWMECVPRARTLRKDHTNRLLVERGGARVRRLV